MEAVMSPIFAVTVVVPFFSARTYPLVETLATLGSELSQVAYFASVVLDGSNLRDKVLFFPLFRVSLLSSK